MAFLVIVAASCRRSTPVTVDRASLPTTVDVKGTYTATLRASEPSSFMPCQGREAGYDVTPEGKVTWTPTKPETKELCAYVSAKGRSMVRFTWTVTASWPAGRSPKNARQLLGDLRRQLAEVSTANAPSACPDATVAAARAKPIPLVLHDDLAGTIAPTHALGGWRSMAFLADLDSDPGAVGTLEAAPYVLLVEASTYVEPALGLDHRFQGGSFVGAIVLVERATKTARCRARLTFESSELVYAARDEDVRRDFRDRGTHALFGALAAMSRPPLEVDLPNMLPETLARLK